MANVLVTGASRGIGRITALHLARGGWEVVAGVRKEEDGKALESEGDGRIRSVVLDITDDKQVDALGEVLPERLDAVVNNAGIVVGGAVETVAVDDVRRQLEVNVVGQLAVTQKVLPRIRAAQGRIVFVSSVSGRISTPMTGIYSASKFALEAMADALRLELRPWHIPVVLVEPAQTDTDLWRAAMDILESEVARLSPEHRALYAGHIEGQRKSIPRSQKMASPADGVATVVAHALATRRPKARYVVGAVPKAMASAVGLMPARLRDAVLAASTGVPRRV